MKRAAGMAEGVVVSVELPGEGSKEKSDTVKVVVVLVGAPELVAGDEVVVAWPKKEGKAG